MFVRKVTENAKVHFVFFAVSTGVHKTFEREAAKSAAPVTQAYRAIDATARLRQWLCIK